ncbi:DMT family transporter [Haliangium ochraceum]|uniref:EamA domain-containing protein n=1 Tax=Haliangium ochraceum (strain DSM 14365 / JCM 11303 / SMP-2) TaxID=502025 RepID=D0LKW6_HALO1|nr:DMT family transporter [Haliangium ochraceum]ACY16686.1 protein of unknown function DUF6 transmembrane [Haliangium ochraceum DSM 14365]
MGDRSKGLWLSLVAAFTGGGCVVAFKAAATGAPIQTVVLAAMLCAASLNTLLIGGLGAPLMALGYRLFGRTRAAAEDTRAPTAPPAAEAAPGSRWLVLGLAAFLAVCTLGANLSMLRSLTALNPAITAVLAKSEVLFVGVLSWPLLGERPTPRFALGALLALLGFGIMHVPVHGFHADAGSLWALSAALCWACMQLAARKFIRRVSPGQVNAVRLWLCVTGMLLVPGAAAGVLELSSQMWLFIALGALGGPFLSRLLLLHAVRFVSASLSSLVSLVSPVFAAVIALLAFGTLPSTLEMLGAGVVLIAVAMPIRELATKPGP